MKLSCPSCQAPLALGAQFCSSCGSSVLLAATPGSAEAVCAVHPELRGVGTCTRCGAFACAQCLRQGGSNEVLCAPCHEREPAGLLPWDRREELGTVKAFWKTCWDLLLKPTATLNGIRPTAPLGNSLYFSLMCSVAGFFTTGVLYVLIFGVFFSYLPMPETAGADAPDVKDIRFFAMLGMGAWTLLMPFLAVLATFLSSCLDHVILKLSGAERSFEVTVRANALSQAPFIVGLVPFIAMYASPFWAVGLRVVTYRTLHRLGWGPAVAGALAVPVLSCVLCGGGYLAIIVMALSSAGGLPK